MADCRVAGHRVRASRPRARTTGETLFTVGNGRLGTRGSLEEGHSGELSGTFLGGVYDGHEVPVIDLVNAPDWLDAAVFVNGVRLDVDTARSSRTSALSTCGDGMLHADAPCSPTPRVAGPGWTPSGARAWPTAGSCALRVEVTPEDHESDVVVESGIDGDRRNLERLPVYPQGTTSSTRETRWEKWARAKHLEEAARSADSDGAVYLRDAHDRHRASSSGYARRDDLRRRPPTHGPCSSAASGSAQRTVHHCAPGETLRMDKLVAICTSRDPGEAGPLDERCRAVLAEHHATRDGFDAVVAASREVWARLWEDCDCEVVGDAAVHPRGAVRHLPPADRGEPRRPDGQHRRQVAVRRGLPRARLLGHRDLDAARSSSSPSPTPPKALLRYRYHTLDGGAGELAASSGTGGARYAWESADTGREECPKFTVDGANRFWTREEEIHVSADVAYGIFRYVEATGDTAFLREFGAEVLFETSRFWVDRATPTADGAGYELKQVMGPDEFHSHVDNNAFTNRLAQWHLALRRRAARRAARQRPRLDTVAAAIGLKPEERDRWRAGRRRPRRAPGRSTACIEQFAGYFERDDVPITEWDENNMPRYPKGYHHFNCETTQLLKQPDVVMLMLPAAGRVQRPSRSGPTSSTTRPARCTSRR